MPSLYPSRYGTGRHGARQAVALHQRAAHGEQHLAMGLGFYPFGHDYG